jgi:RNA polymerase sigma-70 factor (ECF subfamily)
MNHTELRAQLAELHPMSFGWALSCSRGDHAMADDVLQNAYVKVLDGSAQFSGKSTFKTWLFGLIRNTAREERRRQLLRSAGLLRYEPPKSGPIDPGSVLSQKESCQRILLALATLSPRQREVLHLVFYQDLTIEQASQVMNVSLGSARKHYQRGKEQLRKCLEERSHESN